MPFFSRYASSFVVLAAMALGIGGDRVASAPQQPAQPSGGGLVGPLGRQRPGRVVVGGRQAGDGLGRRRLATAIGRSRRIWPTPIRITRPGTAFAAASTRGWPGPGSATTRSASTVCRSSSSRPSSISIPTTERASARDRAHLEARGGAAARQRAPPRPRWTFDHLGVGPESGRLRGRRRAACRGTEGAAAVRLRLRESADLHAAVELAGEDARRPPAGAAGIHQQQLLLAEGEDGRQGGELGARPAGVRQPRLHRSRVLLLRRLPRRARRRERPDEVPARHAEHGDRSAVPTRSC